MGRWYLDKGLSRLVGVNLAVTVLALFQNWHIGYFLWPYWFQSVAIGAVYAHRMWGLKQFSTDGMELNGRPVRPTPAAKRSAALLFVLHYGFFHLVYFFFLSALATPPGASEMKWLLGSGVLLAADQVYTGLSEDRSALFGVNLGKLMMFPYVRIIPLHLTIIFGLGFSGGGLFALGLFAGLKTFADGVLYVLERRVLGLRHEPLPMDVLR